MDYDGGLLVPSLPNLCTLVACRWHAAFWGFILCILELLFLVLIPHGNDDHMGK